MRKTTLPGRKQVYRTFNEDAMFRGADVIAFENETNPLEMHHPYDPLKSMSLEGKEKEPLLQPVMKEGKRIVKQKPLTEIRDFGNSRLKLLQPEYKRFHNPHEYKVGISNRLKEERDQLIAFYKP